MKRLCLARRIPRPLVGFWLSWVPFALAVLLVGCSHTQSKPTDSPAQAGQDAQPTYSPLSTATPSLPQIDLTLASKDVAVGPQPLRAGFPFTVTAQIHNNAGIPAMDVPVIVYISPDQEQIGYSPFLDILTVTLPTTQPVTVKVPVRWNLAGGEHRLWVQVNRVPQAWQSGMATQPEEDVSDNTALLDLMVQPFDAYESDLCPGRVDVEVGPGDVTPELDQQLVRVWVHNLGNRAVYNLPVVVVGRELTGASYTPAIPPCGGTAEVSVPVDRPLLPGERFTVEVNPEGWDARLPEDGLENNRAEVSVGLASATAATPGSELEDYDFSISPADISTPQPWILLVTVRNLGTRDAASVPIRVENQAGRKTTDSIPLVQGNGQGLAAIRVGALWTRGATLTLTVNPPDARGAYAESNRSNNTATFTLP